MVTFGSGFITRLSSIQEPRGRPQRSRRAPDRLRSRASRHYTDRLPAWDVHHHHTPPRHQIKPCFPSRAYTSATPSLRDIRRHTSQHERDRHTPSEPHTVGSRTSSALSHPAESRAWQTRSHYTTGTRQTEQEHITGHTSASTCTVTSCPRPSRALTLPTAAARWLAAGPAGRRRARAGCLRSGSPPRCASCRCRSSTACR